jgi:hypothetical protein
MCRFSPIVLIVLNILASTAAWSQGAKPTVTAVANVASYANGPISPGEMVVVFGSGMGPPSVVGFQLDQQGRIATTLSQVQVLFDGNPAPLIYVSAKQISAMVPYGITGTASTQIQVVYQGSTSDSFQKPIAPSAPGIFTADSSGQGQAAMTNADGSYNTSSNPAAPGSYVTFYLTGRSNQRIRLRRQHRNLHSKRSTPGYGSDCGANSAASLCRISTRKREWICPNQRRH